MPSWSGLPMPLRPGSGAVRIDAACQRVSKLRRPVWLLAMLLWASGAMAWGCWPEREPTAEERKQLADFQQLREANHQDFHEAMRADPLLSPLSEAMERLDGLMESSTPDPDPRIDAWSGQDELLDLALALVLAQEELHPQLRQRIHQRWQERGLPWTVLAAEPVDLDDVVDRARYETALRESMALPLNNPLAIRARELGIRYFELKQQYPDPTLPEALQAFSCRVLQHDAMQQFGIVLAALDATTLGLGQTGVLGEVCVEPLPELDAVCSQWSAKLKRESLAYRVESDEADVMFDFEDHLEACGPATLLRAVQDHHGDWDAVEARLRDCMPVAAEVADRAPD